MKATKTTTTRKPKHAGGRPTKYRKEFVEQAGKLCRLYATNADLADFFGVSERTIEIWQFQHPEFGEAIKRTKAEVDKQVEHSLARRALGYSHASEEVFQYRGKAVRVKTVKQYPPDTTACIFWLKNRQSEAWRQNPDPADGEDTPPPARVEVVVVDGRKRA